MGQPAVAAHEGVADRLAAIRDAVSAIDQSPADVAKADGRLAWYNGWGYWRPFGNWWNNWHNWPNWGNYFRPW